jgi:hypothetical protein
VKLSWTTSGSVTSCGINNGVGQGLLVNGNVTVSPKVTTAYTLTCVGSGGTDTKSLAVTVAGSGQIECNPSGCFPVP